MLQPGWNELGKSHEGRIIRAYANFDSGKVGAGGWTLILGGTHGDERATVPFLEHFIECHLGNGKGLGATAVLPVLNPDGYERNTRHNARGVDLNRNFPGLWSADADEPPGPHALSEPESRLLHDLLSHGKPARIISLHWALSEIDADGEEGYKWGRSLWERLHPHHRSLFRMKMPDSGSFLPGSLGTFCRTAMKNSVHLLTLELPYHYKPELNPLPEDHFITARRVWDAEREKYWQAVYPAVESLLLSAVGSR